MGRALPFLAAITLSLGAVAGDEAAGEAGQPSDLGVERFIEGDVPLAISLEQACASKDGRCHSLALEMREFKALADRAPGLTEEELRHLFALDRNISPHQWSTPRRRASADVAGAQCSFAKRAFSKHEYERACAAARLAEVAVPGDGCAEEIRNQVQRLPDEAWREPTAKESDAGVRSLQAIFDEVDLHMCFPPRRILPVIDTLPVKRRGIAP